MVRIMKMVCVHREQDIEKKLNKMVETLSSEPDAVRPLSLKTIEKKNKEQRHLSLRLLKTRSCLSLPLACVTAALTPTPEKKPSVMAVSP